MIRTVIGRPVAIAMTYFAIAALGILAWRNMPIEYLPDTTHPQLTVSGGWPGTSAEVLEAFYTAPLEAEIQQVRGVETITSTSGQGTATINVSFALDTDMEFARLELSERMAAFTNSAAFPAGARNPTVSPFVPREFSEQNSPILTYTVTGPYTLEFMREHLIEHVEPDLGLIRGVGRIDVLGGRGRILAIELEEHRILSLGLTPGNVRQAVQRMEIVQQAGAVDVAPGQFRPIAIRQRAESLEDIRNLAIPLRDGRMVRLRDVGFVYETLEEPSQLHRINSNPALSFQVYKAPRTNTVETADSVKAALAVLEQSMPPGIEVILERDQSTQVRAQLSDVRNRALIAAAIVLLVLLAFLRSIRAAAVVFTTVIFAVLITLNVMYFAGFTLNVLTLMGVAMGFGLVVDGAIVVLENIFRYRRLGLPPFDAAEWGARHVLLPILAATATTVVVLVPFVYLQGDLRIYYVPLAMVVGIALLASLFVAFTYIPALGARLLGAVKPRSDLPPVSMEGGPAALEAALRAPPAQQFFLVRWYGRLVELSLRAPWAVVLIALAMLGGSWHLFDSYVTRNRLWSSYNYQQDTYVTIDIRQPRGESLARTDELTRFFEDKLMRMPEVERFETNVYPLRSNIYVTFPEEIEQTQIPVAIQEQLVQYSLQFGGTDVRVRGSGPAFSYGSSGGGSPPNYRIKILGYNFDQVRAIAEDLGGRLMGESSRIRDVDTNATGSYTRDKEVQVIVDVNRTRLGMHDLSAQDVVNYVSSVSSGRSNTRANVRVGGREQAVEVKLEDFEETDRYRLENTLVPSRSGSNVRLAQIADIYEQGVLSSVRRENQQYERTVAYEFRGPGKLGDKVRDDVVNATLLLPGYTIETSRPTISDSDKRQIWGVLAVSILLVFMVTAALFESVRQPLCVLLTVPMALIGVFYTFFLVSASFTQEAYVGVIMMGGIVVNNAILLVDHVNHLRRKQGLELEVALVRGTQERVRPILMTSLTTIFGLLPLVLFSETANSNIWNALAYTLIGGLSSSMVLVLSVTPALYLLFERPRWPWAWWLARRRQKKALAAATA